MGRRKAFVLYCRQVSALYRIHDRAKAAFSKPVSGVFSFACQLIAGTVLALGLMCESSFAVFEIPRGLDDQENQKVLDSLPTWLLQNSFTVTQRVEYILDGSEEAGGLMRRSETRESLVFQDSDHWRVRRTIPFTESFREVLKRPEGFYQITLSNRKIPSPKEYSHELWQSLVTFPFELTRRWGLLIDSGTWGDWFQTIAQKSEPLENIDGDRLRIHFEESEGVRSLRLNFEGEYLYQGELKLRLRGEWQIEIGKEISDQMLQTALVEGSD